MTASSPSGEIHVSPTAEQLAAEAAQRILQAAADAIRQRGRLLLGLGDDGHTASLFPGKPALHETAAWVTSSPPGVLPPPVDRVTLTFPVLNAARQVMFLVVGAGKARPLYDVLKGHATLDA